MNKTSLKLTVDFTKKAQYGDNCFSLYREDTIFLPDEFTYQELEDLLEFKYIKRMLRKKDVEVALIKCVENKSSYPSNFTFTPICKFRSEVNGTVTQTHWYDKCNRYFDSGAVVTINTAIQEIQNTMYNCQDWDKEGC